MKVERPDDARQPNAFWCDAARPTLFTAAARPDLIIALLLAHLMSPRVWALAARAVRTAGPDFLARIAAINHFVNHRFYHAGKFDFGRFWGLQERETLADPIERAESDYAMSALLHCMPRSISDAPTIELMMTWLRQGLCPQYVYPTIEIMEALTTVCVGATKRTVGITSCLDECVLIAALSVAAGCCRLNDLVLLGSPFHYALFVLPEGSPGVWLNGKRGMLTETQWKDLRAGDSGRDLQAAFEEKMVYCDRVVTPAGYIRLPQGQATLPADRLADVAERLHRFLGGEIDQLRTARDLARFASGARDTAAIVGRLNGCVDAADFTARLQNVLAETEHPLLEAARYVLRSPDVRYPAAYVAAAQKCFHLLIRSAEVMTLDDALNISHSIPGAQSVFGDSGRLALPDEVLLLGTAGPSERALLVFTLLTLSPALGAEAQTAAQLIGPPDRWQMTWQGHTLSP